MPPPWYLLPLTDFADPTCLWAPTPTALLWLRTQLSTTFPCLLPPPGCDLELSPLPESQASPATEAARVTFTCPSRPCSSSISFPAPPPLYLPLHLPASPDRAWDQEERREAPVCPWALCIFVSAHLCLCAVCIHLCMSLCSSPCVYLYWSLEPLIPSSPQHRTPF